MKNTGGTTWRTSSNYHLGSQDPQDNLVWGYNRAFLSNGDIAPGGTGIFNFSVQAPVIPGTYNFNWQTVQDGGVGWFGQKCTSTVNVVQYAPLSASCQGAPIQTTIGSQVTWSGFPIGGAAPYAYSWTGTDALSGSGATIYKTYTTSGTKNAFVTVTDSIGSSNTASCSISVSPADCPALPPAPDSNSFTPPSGSAVSADQIDFNWNLVPGATGGYYYARSPSVPGACTDAGAYCPNKSQYIPPLTTYRSQLQLGTTYSWWVNSALNNPPAGCPDKGPDSEHATLHICSDSSAPTGLNPSGGGTISEGLSSITWNRSSDINVTHYYLRVDEDPQTPSDFNPAICPTNPSYNYGDVCTGLLPVGSLCDATTCSYDYNFRAGHSYTYWVHEVVDGDPLCFGDAAAPTSPFTATAPTPTPGPWMRINGDVHSNEDIRLPFKQ